MTKYTRDFTDGYIPLAYFQNVSHKDNIAIESKFSPEIHGRLVKNFETGLVYEIIDYVRTITEQGCTYTMSEYTCKKINAN